MRTKPDVGKQTYQFFNTRYVNDARRLRLRRCAVASNRLEGFCSQNDFSNSMKPYHKVCLFIMKPPKKLNDVIKKKKEKKSATLMMQ